MPGLDLEVIAYRARPAEYADEDADAQEGYQQRPHDGRERYKRDQCAGHAAHDLVQQQGVQSPLDDEGQQAAEHAEHQTLYYERAADKAVGRADHAHDRYLLAPGEGGELYRVGHDKEGDDDEYDDKRQGHYADDVPRRYEALGIVEVRVDVGDAVDRLEVGFRLGGEAYVGEVDDIPVAEHALVQAVKQLGVVVLLEVLHGLGAAHEFRPCHVGHRLDKRLYRPGLLLGEVLVYEGDYLVLALQVGDHLVYVHDQQAEAAHDDKAGHGYRDRGKAHQPVAEYAGEAGLYQITESTQFHSCNTRPFRR